MFKMTFQTLVVIFLTMLIAGREDPAAPQGGTAGHVVAEAAPEAPAPGILRAATIAERESDPVPAALVTPAAVTRMPGPALRPSPEHRVREKASPAGREIWRVGANRLNVRAGPSTGNPVLATLSRGEEVLVVSDPSAGWVQIRIEGDGVEGWVSRKLLTPQH